MTSDRFTRIATAVSVVIVVWAFVVGFAALTVDVRAEQTRAGDDWVDNCEEAETITESGTYNGTIHTPDDVDMLGVQLPEKGAFVTVQLLVPTVEGEFSVATIGSVSIGNTRFQEGVVNDRTSGDFLTEGTVSTIRIQDRSGTNISTFAVFAEQPGQACLGIHDFEPDEATLPYEWQVTLTFNTPGEANPPGQVLSSEEVTQYRQDIRTLSERMTELENTAEDLEQRVANLEQRVADLEQQVANLEQRVSEPESELANQTTPAGNETVAPERDAPNRNPTPPLVPAIALIGVTTFAIRWRS